MSLPRPYFEEGGVTIFHGDAREVVPYLEQFDLLLTDLPYGLGKLWAGGTWARRGQYNGSAPQFDENVISQDLLELIIHKGKQAIIWGGNYYRLPASRCWLIWDKGTRNFTLADGELAWTNLNRCVRIFSGIGRIQNTPDGRFHPTQKPVTLMQWCIQQASSVQTILDPFAGSCSSLVAAKQLGIRAIGIELNEAWCEAGAQRLQQAVLPLTPRPAPAPQPTLWKEEP